MKKPVYLSILLVSVLLAAALLLGGGGILERNPAEAIPSAVDTEGALEHARKHLDPSYVCPMHPEVLRSEPGDCPICGMALAARPAEDREPAADVLGEDVAPVVRVSAAVVNQLGVRTARVVRGGMRRRIETVGYVSESLSGAYYSRSYTRSYPRSNVARPGAVAKADDEAEEEDKQVVIAGEVFERHAHLLKEGQEAEFRLPYFPGRVWKGVVEWLDPEIDPTKRTFLFSMEVAVEDDVLKANMRGEVTLFAEPQQDVLIIPREALIVTGSQQRVVVALGDGRFQPRAVRTGMESGEQVMVLSGLEEGEEVVASAQFLLDSEASLQAGLKRLAEVRETRENDR